MIGVLSPPVLNPNEQASPQFIGSEIAGREFVKNMARHLPASSVGLFVPEPVIGVTKQELVQLKESEGGNYGSTLVWGIRSLPDVLKATPFTAFHNPLAPQLHTLSYLRAQFASRPFPITCSTHGFSQQNLLWDYFARLWLTPTLPCDSILCTSNAARDAFQNTLDQVGEGLREAGMSKSGVDLRLDVVPLGVDTEVFRPRDKNDARRLLGLPRDETLLLYFGRVDHRAKGDLNPLLLAFRELVAKYPDSIALVLAGAAFQQEISHLQQIAVRLGCADRVIVRAHPSAIEGPLYYAAADVFVSLSDTLQESFGLAPLEAMASGLPIVVSDWSGYKETAVHGGTGFRVTTRWARCDDNISLFAPMYSWLEDHSYLSQSIAVDVGELVAYLNVLIQNPQQRVDMGQAAREHVLTHFRWERVMAQYEALWQELSDVAARLPWGRPIAAQLQQPQYFQNFGHFASQHLKGSEHLELTERGSYACKHPEIIFLRPEMQYRLHFKVLLVTLNFVRTTSFLKHRVTIAEACDKIAAKHHLTTQGMMAHILWLLKYGLLQVART